jgi:hypothetical protein
MSHCGVKRCCSSLLQRLLQANSKNSISEKPAAKKIRPWPNSKIPEFEKLPAGKFPAAACSYRPIPSYRSIPQKGSSLQEAGSNERSRYPRLFVVILIEIWRPP